MTDPWRSSIVGEGEEAPDQLLANPFNFRVHPKTQQDAITSALDQVGWIQRVIVNRRSGHVIDGHARVAIAISRGEPTVPVIYVDLDENQERVALLSLDPLGAMAGIDREMHDELMAMASINDDALRAMLDGGKPIAGLTDPDDVPPVPEEPTTRPGDLWLLGVYYECECGVKTELQALPNALRADAPQPEVLRRSVSARAQASGTSEVQEVAQGQGDGAALASESGEATDRRGVLHERKGARKGRAAGQAPAIDPVLPNAKTPQPDGTLPPTAGATDSGSRSVSGVRSNGRSDAGSHPTDVNGRGAQREQPSGSLPLVQRQEEADDHPLCRGCHRQLTLTDRRATHKILCGDSTKAADVARLCGGQRADAVLTDPPYGVSIVKDGMVGADFGVAKKGRYEPIIGDGTPADVRYLNDLATMVVIWGGNYFADQLPASGAWMVWDKRSDSGISNTFADCELAWSNVGGAARVYRQLWNGMIREGEHGKREHPTQKPVALMEWCLERMPKAAVVLDPFLGSGTTLIACERLGRRAYCVEIEPRYVDVAVKRWEQFTGKKAHREGQKAETDKAPSRARKPRAVAGAKA